MMLYERGNAAKQWMLEELDALFQGRSARVLDLACGDGSKWSAFIASHPNWQVVGADTDRDAIARGRAQFANRPQIEFRVFDAQRAIGEESFDAVVAMSAMEHVVDHRAFLRTVWSALRPGGVALLNYDAGHFRSRDWKERLMVPLSQVFATVGIEGPYMKRVNDGAFVRKAEAQGFRVVQIRKHNLAALKGLMRGASDEAVQTWYSFEEQLGSLFPPDRLDAAMLSTTVVLERPDASTSPSA